MKQEELQEILRKHKLWYIFKKGGERADLCATFLYRVNLRRSVLGDANLCWANLDCANLYDSNLSHSDLSNANLSNADLSFCDLSCANMFGTRLDGANLYGANLDYSCLPLRCESLSAHFDDRQLKQIAYHLVKAGLHSKNASKETKAELAKLIEFANGFHRAEECGKIEWDGES